MTGWNMPPGVNTSDIPGNRPEDEAWEKVIEEFCESLTKEEQEFLEKRVPWVPPIISILEKAIQYGIELERKHSYETMKEDRHYSAEAIRSILLKATDDIDRILGEG